MLNSQENRKEEPDSPEHPEQSGITQPPIPYEGVVKDAIIKGFSPNKELGTSKKKALTPQIQRAVINRTARIIGISSRSAIQATHLLLRKGAANASSSDQIDVQFYCADTDKAFVLSKFDLRSSLERLTGERNLRKLAEAMALPLVEASLAIIKMDPNADQKGDLANKINRRLALRKEDLLTREEEVCCCTYAQHLPNLDKLANSTRLKRLMEEDLALGLRRNINKKKGPSPKGKNDNKGKNSNQGKSQIKSQKKTG